MIQEHIEGSNDPSNPLMESKQILVETINRLNNALDSIGFYVFDYDLLIDSPKQILDIDELRHAVINKQAAIRFKMDAFISNSVWSAFEEDATRFFGLEIIPLADLFNLEQDDEEEEE